MMKRWIHGLVYAIFWGWNALFILGIYAGLLPLLAQPLVIATLNQEVPLEFTLSFLVLVAVPVVCTVIGAIRFRSQPLNLLRLFYGVEAPLMVLCLLRLFVLRELTPASTQILVSIGIGLAAFGADLLYGYARRHAAIAHLQAIAHSLMMLVGLYSGIVLLFYALPLAVYLVQQFFSFQWLGVLTALAHPGYLFSAVWWGIVFLLLVAASGTLFVLMPSLMTSLFIHSGQRLLRAFAQQYGRQRAWCMAGGVTVASLVMFVGLQQQPQVRAMALLERPATTDQARQELLAQSDAIRTGLVNAYLAKYRYLSTEQQNNHIQVMYEHVFGLPKPLAQGLQVAYNRLMSPFIYRGSAADIQQAEQWYGEFFDTSIQKGERDAINRALQATFNRDEARAGLLNFNQRQVWLKSQDVTVKEHGDWAEVELYEVYENQTPLQQEIFYSFSLPESAVITGVWLGDTSDRNQRFPFVVSPRGAAQKVYNQQVQWRLDPALLEQVGPRHYRLRAFPIPPKPEVVPQPLSTTEPPRPTQMHLWLTYQVMQQDQGWPMPILAEKRNLFWTSQTERRRNGQVVQSFDDWLEAALPATQKMSAIAHQTMVAEGYRVTATPVSASARPLPTQQRVAVVLDTSRSMAAQRPALQQTLEWLKQHGFASSQQPGNDADLYLTATAGAKPQRLDDLNRVQPQQLTFYGSLRYREMLQQFAELRGKTPYDAILLITDAGSYDLAADDDAPAATTPSPADRRAAPAQPPASTQRVIPTLPDLAAPLWLVHLGGQPAAYDDATLKAIQDWGGGVADSVDQVMRRLALQQTLGSDGLSVTDGYAWTWQSATLTEPVPQTRDPFAPLAARQLITGLSRTQDLTQLENLDRIHDIAKRAGIVTPYSSMLVLVNDQQRAALKRAEAERDRFNRTVETGTEQLSQPFDPMNVAVPEGPAWLGLLLAGGAVVCLKRCYRRVRLR